MLRLLHHTVLLSGGTLQPKAVSHRGVPACEAPFSPGLCPSPSTAPKQRHYFVNNFAYSFLFILLRLGAYKKQVYLLILGTTFHLRSHL